MHLVTDDYLDNLYLEDGNIVFLSNGEIYTTDYDSPRLASIVQYVRDTPGLLDGKFFGTEPTVKIESKTVIDDYRKADEQMDAPVSGKDQASSAVAERLRFIQQQAADKGSSDIHIEKYETNTQVYCRVDGLRINILNIRTAHYAEELFAYIFNSIATDKDSDFVEKDVNNGRIKQPLVVEGIRRETTWRVSYMPAKDGGGKVTVRWLDKNLEIPPLESMGYAKGHCDMFRRFINGPSGNMLVAGKTGSGKSTLIAAILKLIDPSRSVQTLEDPPEFPLGIIQTQVQPRQKVTEDGNEYRDFTYYSPVMLRHDIDVEMHSEIRNHKGAMEVTRKGETGQLMLTTLHTSSAIGIAHTLTEQLNVPAAVVAAPDLMRVWAYQTLVRTLCPHCKVADAEADDIYQRYHEEQPGELLEEYRQASRQLDITLPQEGERDGVFWRNPAGCTHCNMGEKGRTALIEMIVLDDEDRQFILNRDYLNWGKALKAKGYRNVRDHAISKIKAGLIDINTAAKKVNDLLPVASATVYQSFIE